MSRDPRIIFGMLGVAGTLISGYVSIKIDNTAMQKDIEYIKSDLREIKNHFHIKTE